MPLSTQLVTSRAYYCLHSNSRRRRKSACLPNVAVTNQAKKQVDHGLHWSCTIECGNLSAFDSPVKGFLAGGSTGSSNKGFLVLATANANKLQSEDPHEVEDKSLKKYAWSDAKKPKICILGGGFGGLYTALRLESLVWPADKKPEVLVVDQADRFVFKPMLYELLSKEVDIWEVAPLFKDLLNGTGIRFQQDKVTKILPFDKSSRSQDGSVATQGNEGTVVLESGLEIDYDWYVIHAK